MINDEMCLSTRIVYGPGRHNEIGSRLKKYTDKVLLIYGGGSIRRSGLYDDIVTSLKDNGIAWEELSGVKSNPVLSKVQEGIDLCREKDIRFLLAVGGGSVVDTGKAISCGVEYEGNVWDFYSDKAVIESTIPLAVVLTIPGTGAEISVNAILSNEETREKRGAASDMLRPVLSILDPALCLSVPESQIASGVYDMFSHTMERYMTPTPHTDVIDGVAEGVMKAILRNGLAVRRNPKDVDAWGELMLASNYSHSMLTGFGSMGDWSNHDMEEIISGFYDIPHGAGLSVITPQWMRYVYKRHIPMFVQFAVNVMGVRGPMRNEEEIAYEGILALEDFSRKMGLPLHLSEMGVDDKEFETMAKMCTGYKGGTLGRLEALDWEDVLAIYKASL